MRGGTLRSEALRREAARVTALRSDAIPIYTNQFFFSTPRVPIARAKLNHTDIGNGNTIGSAIR